MNQRWALAAACCAALGLGAEACGPGMTTDAGDTGGADAATDAPPQDAPADAPADTGGTLRFTQVSAASFAHTCAVMSDETVRCWGLNDNGQLGSMNSSSTCELTSAGERIMHPCETRPREVAGLTGVREVTTGRGHSCALKRDGTVWCWGLNDVGQLGRGMRGPQRNPTPAQVTLPMPARALAAGTFHTCAALMDGSVRCWGDNFFNQLGVPAAMSPDRCEVPPETRPCAQGPVAVAGLTTVRALSLGRWHSCALREDNTVVCWGLNDSAQLGLGMADTMPHPSPAPVVMPGGPVQQVSAGGSHTCLRLMDGSVRCVGWNDIGTLGLTQMMSMQCSGGGGPPFACAPTPTAVPGITGAVNVSAGRYHTCVVSAAGVHCFGRNSDGQLGIGGASPDTCTLVPDSFPCARSPQMLSNVAGATQVAVADSHSCAVISDGTAMCWGWNALGQLGDGTTMNRNAPVAVQLRAN